MVPPGVTKETMETPKSNDFTESTMNISLGISKVALDETQSSINGPLNITSSAENSLMSIENEGATFGTMHIPSTISQIEGETGLEPLESTRQLSKLMNNWLMGLEDQKNSSVSQSSEKSSWTKMLQDQSNKLSELNTMLDRFKEKRDIFRTALESLSSEYLQETTTEETSENNVTKEQIDKTALQTCDQCEILSEDKMDAEYMNFMNTYLKANINEKFVISNNLTQIMNFQQNDLQTLNKSMDKMSLLLANLQKNKPNKESGEK